VIIDIVGTGITSGFYNWPEDHEIWSIGVAYKMHQLQEHKADLYFCFHDELEDDIKEAGIPSLDKDSYPLDEIVEKFGSKYFTSSIAYMLALAITKKPEEINIWGIDMEQGTEYAHQRPCVLYWIGQAEARGITVDSSSKLAKSTFMYGYDDNSELLRQLEMRMAHAEKMGIKATKIEEKNQWIGKMVGMRDAISIIKS
jgi:hypothetical protein